MAMRTYILLFFLFVFTFSLNAQERKDGYVVVNLSKSETEDLKCEVIQGFTDGDIKPLMDDGRYIVAVTPTKFGCLVLHRKNTNSIKQVFDYVPAYNLKKKLKEMFNKGYSLSYYNDQRTFAVFDKNPKITIQEFVKDINDKKIEKYNTKGLYVKVINYNDAVVQDGHNPIGGVIIQTYKYFIGSKSEIEMLKDFIEYSKRGWKVGSVTSSYNQYGDWNAYNIIYDKNSIEDNSIKELLGIINTQDEMTKFISEYNNRGYSLLKTWCGWEAKAYNAISSYSEENSSSFLDILGGIVDSASKLASGNVIDTPVQNSSSFVSEGSSYSGSSTSSSYSSSSSTSNNNKVNHANWKSLDNSYNGYENQLMRMHSSGSIDKNEVRSIQNKMKDIRKKIYEQSGHQRAVSQWESWNP